MKVDNERKIIILTGPVHSGKSGALMHWVDGKSVCGFITPTINKRKVLLNVATTFVHPYEVDSHSNNAVQIGKYFLDNRSFEIAANLVTDAIENPIDWFVFDEIGKLELAGNGHYKSLILLLNNWQQNLILVVREQLVEEVISTFNLQKAFVIDKQKLKVSNF